VQRLLKQMLAIFIAAHVALAEADFHRAQSSTS
jgi:hypothetical protein